MSLNGAQCESLMAGHIPLLEKRMGLWMWKVKGSAMEEETEFELVMEKERGKMMAKPKISYVCLCCSSIY